jgi:hypothetical protein
MTRSKTEIQILDQPDLKTMLSTFWYNTWVREQ